jgi:hypothetical protein
MLRAIDRKSSLRRLRKLALVVAGVLRILASAKPTKNSK